MKQAIKLNASGLKTSTCGYHFWNTCVEGYKNSRSAAKMVYGIGLHKYVDTMFQTGGRIDKARDAALAAFRKPKVDDKKSRHMSDENHFLPTCFNYWDEWIMKDTAQTVLMPDNKPATEVTFSIPYYEDEHIFVTLEGTIDRLIKIRGGCFAVNDFKTTSSWESDYYLRKYSMSNQLRFYVLSLKLMAEKFPDSMLGQIGATNIGACIDGIFLKPKPCDNEYKRSDVFQFNDLDQVRRSLDMQIQRISKMVEYKNMSGLTPPRDGLINGACEQKFRVCNFWAVCNSQSREVGDLILGRDFVKKEYDPLHHND
jgi:hypothetical protein